MSLALDTRTKIALARTLRFAVMAWRRLWGLGNVVDTARHGVRWRLDLNEGIDFALYLFGRFEPETVRAYGRAVKPGDVVLDIGANMGSHVLFLADAAGPTGKVFAFEPTAYAYKKLTTNIALNPVLARTITAEQIMLVDDSAAPIPDAIYSSWPLSAPVDAQHPKHLGMPMQTTGARQMTLDDYLETVGAPTVRFVKMDVDGYECTVLRGAQKMLKRDKPLLLMEMMPYGLAEAGGSLEELLGLLSAAGYRPFRLDGTPLPADASIATHIPAAGSINVLCKAV
jgi:FkbM family methyltransferase